MAIKRANNFIDAYRYRATAADPHEMSGRGRQRALTEWVNAEIGRHLTFGRDDVVLDVGCGDGSLLASVSVAIREGVGIAPTREEVARLAEVHAARRNLQFRVGRVESLDIEKSRYTKIICNGVFILLDDRAAVERALDALLDAAAPGGRVWLGEVPDRDEAATARAAYGDSLVRWWWYSTRKQGLRAGARVVFTIGRALLTREPLIVQPKRCNFVPPDEMKALLAVRPCRLLWHGPYQPPSAGLTTPTRWHYLVEKTT
jgi:SAM-dependent methyltransferase